MLIKIVDSDELYDHSILNYLIKEPNQQIIKKAVEETK